MSRNPGKEALERMSFKLYFDMRPQFDEMTDAEAGKIVKACFAYILDGADTDFSNDDRLVRSFWTSTKLKLDGQNRDRETKSANGTRAANARWNRDREGRDSPDTDTEGEESERIQMHTDAPTKQNKTEQHRTGPVHNSTGTRTDTEQIQVTDSVIDSAERCAVAAGNAAPLAHDSAGLFTIEQLRDVVQSNKIPITDDGLNTFFEEMTDSEWILYGTPVERRFIARSLRGWLKYHKEYSTSRPAGHNEEITDVDEYDDLYMRQLVVEKYNELWSQDLHHTFSWSDGNDVNALKQIAKSIHDNRNGYIGNGFTDEEISYITDCWGVEIDTACVYPYGLRDIKYRKDLNQILEYI